MTFVPAPYEGKTDPRISRTRKHVIETARQMLAERSEPLSFTSVAERAFVARQTLYKHWGNIENLLADTIELPEPASDVQLTTQQKVSQFLESLSHYFSEGAGTAIAAIFSAAHYADGSGDAVTRMDSNLYSAFKAAVGEVDHDGFAQVAGPVIYLGMAGIEPSAALIESLAARASNFLK